MCFAVKRFLFVLIGFLLFSGFVHGKVYTECPPAGSIHESVELQGVDKCSERYFVSTVDGHIVFDCGGAEMADYIVVGGYSDRIEVKNCRFTGENGVLYYNSGNGAHIVISDNTFKNSKRGITGVHSFSGGESNPYLYPILLRYGTLEISDNQFKNNYKGISAIIMGGRIDLINLRIYDNSFKNCEFGIAGIGFAIKGIVRGNVFENNHFDIAFDPSEESVGGLVYSLGGHPAGIVPPPLQLQSPFTLMKFEDNKVKDVLIGSVLVSSDYGVETFEDNHPPVADFVAIPREGIVPLTVDFFGDLSFDPDGDSLAFHWVFSDRVEEKEVPVFFLVFDSPEPIEVTLTVRDSGGLTDSVTKQVYPYSVVSVTDVNVKRIMSGEVTEVSVGCTHDVDLNLFLFETERGGLGSGLAVGDYVCNSGFVEFGPSLERGVYLVSARIEGERCSRCVKNEYFVVGRAPPEFPASELSLWLVVLIGFSVLIVLKKKSG